MVVINTGDDQCPGGAPQSCLRMGVPTDLLRLRLGPAIGKLLLQSCDNPGSKRCVYARRFEGGLVVVNPTDQRRPADLLNAKCHRMFRIRGGWLNGGDVLEALRREHRPARSLDRRLPGLS